MRIVILGGTGSIGTAVTRHLVAEGHTVTGLARSDHAAQRLQVLGARPVLGDISDPNSWSDLLVNADALVHLAATFDNQMARADQCVTQAILACARVRSHPLRVLYTGGCWLYGATGDQIANERSPLRPIAPFAFMQTHARQLSTAGNLSVAVVHPALVYHGEKDAPGGAFRRMIEAAQKPDPIEVWGSVHTRWPLIERNDLASAYTALVSRPELTGPFNVTAEQGVPVGKILQEICQRYGHDGSYIVHSEAYVKRNFGLLAEGPMLDQQMDATKIKAATGWTPVASDFRSQAF